MIEKLRKARFFLKMIHEMRLRPTPFEQIKSGEKTVELRLYDEKRSRIKLGDYIVFTNTESGERLKAAVTALHRFDNFTELYSALPLIKCGYTAENISLAKPEDMAEYYSKEEQSKYGVLGIEIEIKN